MDTDRNALHSDALVALAKIEKGLAKGTLRFGVGSAGSPCSAVWRAWDHGDEFYLGARGMLGNTKISLHQSGNCRLAVNESAAASLDLRALPRADRALVKWKRSKTPDEGAQAALSIFFPTDFLALPASEGLSSKPAIICPAAGPGKAVQFSIFFTREEISSIEKKFLSLGRPISWWNLPNGDYVWLAAREMDFDTAWISNRSRIVQSEVVLDPDGLPPPGGEIRNLSGILWNIPAEGEALEIVEVGGITARRSDLTPQSEGA